MEGSHHVKLNNVMYREEAIHRTEIERLFLAAKGFNINLVQFLLWCHVVISNVHIYPFTLIISHMHLKKVLHAQSLRYKN